MTQIRQTAVGDYVFNLLESGPAGRDTVLWLHGSGPGANAATNWTGVLQLLASDWHHIAPDMIGFGDSTHPDPPPASASAFAALRAATLLELLDVLDLDRVHVVGNSMGGIIALAMALKAPERFGRIVLMGSGGAPVAPTDDLIRLINYYQQPTVEALAELMRAMTYDPAALGQDLSTIAASRMERIERPEVRRSHLATFAVDTPGVYSPEQLAAISHPALVVHGREDKIMPVAAGYYLAQHIPDAQLHVFPHAGHWVQLEKAQQFVALVNAFLSGNL